jgi:hypothetical protein
MSTIRRRLLEFTSTPPHGAPCRSSQDRVGYLPSPRTTPSHETAGVGFIAERYGLSSDVDAPQARVFKAGVILGEEDRTMWFDGTTVRLMTGRDGRAIPILPRCPATRRSSPARY